MVFIETHLDAAHEATAFWVEPPEALMLASFKVSVSQVVIVPFVTAFVLSHSTEAHHIPAMASEEPTPHNNYHLSEKEEDPSPDSLTDSWQGDPSSHAEHKACRDNKGSRKEEVENKENQTKRKAKTKRAESLKEGSPTPVLSVSYGSIVIDCSDGSMITIYREYEGRFLQTGWAPPSKEKPVVLANSKNSVLSGSPLKSSNKWSLQDQNPSSNSLHSEISEHTEDQHYLVHLLDGDSDAEDRDSDSGSEHKELWLHNPALKGLGLEGVMENNLQNSSQRLHSRQKILAQPEGNLTHLNIIFFIDLQK